MMTYRGFDFHYDDNDTNTTIIAFNKELAASVKLRVSKDQSLQYIRMFGEDAHHEMLEQDMKRRIDDYLTKYNENKDEYNKS